LWEPGIQGCLNQLLNIVLATGRYPCNIGYAQWKLIRNTNDNDIDFVSSDGTPSEHILPLVGQMQSERQVARAQSWQTLEQQQPEDCRLAEAQLRMMLRLVTASASVRQGTVCSWNVQIRE